VAWTFRAREYVRNFHRQRAVDVDVKRAAPAILTALGLLSVVALRAPDAKAADSANDCVRMRETQEGAGLTLSVDNNCDRRLTCSVGWTVQCESATGKITRRSKEAARFVVGSSTTENAFASAKSCGDNWKIEEVSWDCSPLK
jgi:hypothetical protein